MNLDDSAVDSASPTIGTKVVEAGAVEERRVSGFRTRQHRFVRTPSRLLLPSALPDPINERSEQVAYVTEKRGVFYAVLYEGTNPVTGRERRRWHRCETRIEAARLAGTLEQRRRRQRHAGSSMTLRDYLIGQWLPAKETNIAASTHARYVTSVEHYLLPHLGDTQLRRLQPADLESLYRRLLLIGGRRGGPRSRTRRGATRDQRPLRSRRYVARPPEARVQPPDPRSGD